MPDRIIPLYDDNADHWMTDRKALTLDRDWLERFALGLPVKGRVLDLGCGHGMPMADMLIERGYAVTGLDTSPKLIAAAREQFPDGEWIVGDMRRWDAPRLFDGILAWFSFFHLPPDDQRAMIGRFAQLATPGAMLMLTTGPEEGVSMGSWRGSPLYHASLSADTYRGLLEDAGFSLVAHETGRAGGEDPTIWLARYQG